MIATDRDYIKLNNHTRRRKHLPLVLTSAADVPRPSSSIISNDWAVAPLQISAISDISFVNVDCCVRADGTVDGGGWHVMTPTRKARNKEAETVIVPADRRVHRLTPCSRLSDAPMRV